MITLLQNGQRYLWDFHNRAQDPGFGPTPSQILVEVLDGSEFKMKFLKLIGGTYHQGVKTIYFSANRFNDTYKNIENWILLKNQDKV
jgi:hypothetical protein